MKKLMNKYFLLLFIILVSFVGYANEKQAHKPPVLTTTAIIEVYDEGQFKEIVLNQYQFLDQIISNEAALILMQNGI